MRRGTHVSELTKPETMLLAIALAETGIAPSERSGSRTLTSGETLMRAFLVRFAACQCAVASSACRPHQVTSAHCKHYSVLISGLSEK